MFRTGRIGAAAATLAAGALTPCVLLAHAHLVSAEPADGATVDAAPTVINLEFDDALELEFSSFTLRPADAGGHAQDLAAAARAESYSVELAVPGPLAPGGYALEWQIMASDGHVTEGTVIFTVAGE